MENSDAHNRRRLLTDCPENANKRGTKLLQVDLSDKLNRVWLKMGLKIGDVAEFVRYPEARKYVWSVAPGVQTRGGWELVVGVEELLWLMGDRPPRVVDSKALVVHATGSTVRMTCDRCMNSDAKCYSGVECVIRIQSVFVLSRCCVLLLSRYHDGHRDNRST